MIELWKQSPFIRITPPFFLGIVVGTYYPKPSYLWITLMIWIFSFLIHRKKLWKQRHFYGLSLLSLMISLGMAFSSAQSPALQPMHYTIKSSDSIDGYFIQIEKIKKNDSHWKGVASIIAAREEIGTIQLVEGKINFYLEGDTQEIEIDDILFVKNTITPLNGPRHPGAFDYKAFSERKGIYGSLYGKKNKWFVVPGSIATSVTGVLSKFRDKQLKRLDEHALHESEKGIIAALVLGKSDDLDPNVMSGYSSTGVIHVLAVSGMHVALVYMILEPLFKKLLPGRRWRWWRFLIPFFILWFYAALTGFSPSVLRSAVMFTLFLISEQFDESNHSLNTLFASAFLLCTVDTSFLFDIGFLLSYLAVGGIMVMQQPLKALWRPRHYLLLHLREMIAVSIAAQLLTLPLSLWLFGQFPTYFLLANLLVIPLSTVVLYAGLAFFLLGFFSPVAHLSINIANTFVQWMNLIIAWIAEWPYALIQSIHVDFTQMVLLFMLLFLLWQLFFRKKKYGWYFLPVIFLFTALQMPSDHGPNIMISQIRKEILIATGNGDQAVIYRTPTDSSREMLPAKDMERGLQGWCKEHRYIQSTTYTLNENESITWQLGNNNVSAFVANHASLPISCPDILILPAHLAKKKLKIPSSTSSPQFVVLGGYWSDKKIAFLQKRLKIPLERIILLRNGDFIL